MTNVLKKISITDVCGKLPVPVADFNIMFLCGIISEVKMKNTIMGIFPGFIGTFEAANYSTRDTFISQICYMPEPLMYTLHNAFKTEGSVEFSCNVGVVPDKSKKLIVYTFDFIVSPRKVDPLKGLRVEVVSDNVINVETKKAKK